MTSDQPVAAAVIIESQRVLLIRRRVPEGVLVWQFPAGKLKPGETPAQAAVRETREEVGLVVKPVAVLGERIHPATGRQMHYIACTVVSGAAVVAAPTELDLLAWTDLSELASRIPTGLFEPVALYLKTALSASSELPD
jgi:8-oxo-dGTP diphosphatase